MKCFIYRNLHKAGYWYSLKALEGEYKGRVIGHASMMVITHATLKVNEHGRQKVIATKTKNVHAGVVGDVSSAYNLISRLPNQIPTTLDWISSDIPSIELSYNPYKAAYFVDRKTGKPVHEAGLVRFNGALIEAYDVTSL